MCDNEWTLATEEDLDDFYNRTPKPRDEILEIDPNSCFNCDLDVESTDNSSSCWNCAAVYHDSCMCDNLHAHYSLNGSNSLVCSNCRGWLVADPDELTDVDYSLLLNRRWSYFKSRNAKDKFLCGK